MTHAQVPAQSQSMPNGHGRVYQVLADSVRMLIRHDQSGAYELFELTGPCESGPPPHAHDWSESYYVISGTVDVMANGQWRSLRAGEFLHVPGEVSHAYRITSQQAQIIVTTDRKGASAFFAAVDVAMREPDCSMERVVGIALAHGLRLTQ